jgi:hypothetical protein
MARRTTAEHQRMAHTTAGPRPVDGCTAPAMVHSRWVGAAMGAPDAGSRCTRLLSSPLLKWACSRWGAIEPGTIAGAWQANKPTPLEPLPQSSAVHLGVYLPLLHTCHWLLQSWQLQPLQLACALKEVTGDHCRQNSRGS